MKDCTEIAALVSRSSNVGSIIVSPGHKLCRKFLSPDSDINISAKKVKGEKQARKIGWFSPD